MRAAVGHWPGRVDLLLSNVNRKIFVPKDGTIRHQLYFDTDKVEALFRAEVFPLLLDKGLIGGDTVNNMLSWNHSGFSVDTGVRVETIPEAVHMGR